jgi:tetratricopeptide (TPR) repeat protein
VVEVDPLSLVNLIRLARSYSLANRFDDGLSATEKALEFSPSFCPAIEISGHVLVGMGRLDEAIEMFESLPRLGHDRFEGAGGRGYAYAPAGRTDEDRAMVALLEQKMREQPGMAPHYDLAMVHVGLRNDDDAVESRTGPVLWIPVEPHWRPLRPHPGFQQILQAVGR